MATLFKAINEVGIVRILWPVGPKGTEARRKFFIDTYPKNQFLSVFELFTRETDHVQVEMGPYLVSRWIDFWSKLIPARTWMR